MDTCSAAKTWGKAIAFKVFLMLKGFERIEFVSSVQSCSFSSWTLLAFLHGFLIWILICDWCCHIFLQEWLLMENIQCIDSGVKLPPKKEVTLEYLPLIVCSFQIQSSSNTQLCRFSSRLRVCLSLSA